MIDNKTSSFLDTSRWVSAWLVFLGHLRSKLFVPSVDFDIYNIFVITFAFLSTFGRPAVMVFFVLSGYLVGGPLLDT